MELSQSLPLFTATVLAVGVIRLVELGVSRGRRRALAAQGVAPVAERHFAAMVLVHTGILTGAVAEAHLRGQSVSLALAASMLAVVAGANLLRWWVIASLGRHWNVRIMASLPLGVVSDGPFRFIRHPNYLAVFLELCALPLVHGAWLTAATGAVAHAWVLARRIRTEEAMLLADPAYRAAMGNKPRFLPGMR